MSKTNDRNGGNSQPTQAIPATPDTSGIDVPVTQPIDTTGKTAEQLRAEAEAKRQEAERLEAEAKAAAEAAEAAARKAEEEAKAAEEAAKKAKAEAVAAAKASGTFREAFLPRMADGSLGRPYGSPHLAEQASPLGKCELRLCWGAPDGPIGPPLTPDEMERYAQ